MSRLIILLQDGPLTQTRRGDIFDCCVFQSEQDQVQQPTGFCSPHGPSSHLYRPLVSSQLQLFIPQLHADHSAPPPTVTEDPQQPSAPHQSPPTPLCLTVDQVPT
ncbi:hypothetical protein Q5P01_008365 [Channa striata]|uniref:Uncharacterized protein n=1 Tax=Channa striata TaxID=64152 RepID=A0AA88N594_CHASR|nr:hypothetical protein Q5P01_008365 [Channa striata]